MTFNVIHQGSGLFEIAHSGDPAVWLFLLLALGVIGVIVLLIHLYRGGE